MTNHFDVLDLGLAWGIYDRRSGKYVDIVAFESDAWYIVSQAKAWLKGERT